MSDCALKVCRYIGLGLEQEIGVAVPADVHMDVTSIGLDAPSDTMMKYGGGLARSARTQRPGAYISTGPIAYAMDIESIGYLLILALGGNPSIEEVENDFLLYTQKSSQCQIMRTATVRAGKDLFEQVFPGCAVGQLTITSDAQNFCMATADMQGGKDLHAPLEPVGELLLPDGYPLAFQDISISLNGEDRSAKISRMELTINNNADAAGGVGHGRRYPRYIYAGELDIGLSLDIAFHDLTEKEKFWGEPGATEPKDTDAYEEEGLITFDAGAHGSLAIALPRLNYTGVSIQPSGRERITQTVTTEARFSEADESELIATWETKQVIDNAILSHSGS